MSTILSSQRTGRITSSRAPAILGLSPYATRDDVMREMVREHFWESQEFTGNFITEYGREHEPDAVADYEFSRGTRLIATGSEQQTLVHPQLRIAGTPDGLLPGVARFVEIKCPWKARYSVIEERPDYEVQMRLTAETLTAINGEPHDGDFVVWRPGGLTVSPVAYDPDWLGTVWPDLEAFLSDYDAIIADDELARPYRETLVDIRTDAEWAEAEFEYVELKAAIESLQRELAENALQKLISLADDKTTKGPLLTLIRTKGGAGSVSYKKALDTLVPGADVTPFRGPPGKPGWSVRRRAEKEN